MLKSIEFLRGKSRGRVGGGTKLASPAPVILGRDAQSVPRILFQRVSNLVNKLALLLHKCWLREDSWDKPKNDGCRGRRVSAFSQSGRSMIEMLGVLAIIAVLSVAGIAGYSKAMEKFKINKLINEYNMLIAGLVEHKSEFPLVGDDPNGHYSLSGIIMAMNLVPETWKYINSEYLEDSFGNYIKSRSGVVSDMPQIILDFNLGGLVLDADGKQISSSFSEKLCFEMFNNVIYPLHSALVRAYLFRYGVGNVWYYGDSFCGGTNKCISELTLSSIKEICSSCDGARRCNVTIAF